MGRHDGSVDEAVLTELRAIREEIRRLAERVGESVSREELRDYVTTERFDSYVRSRRALVEGWRGWTSLGISTVAMVAVVVRDIFPHIIIR